MATIQIMIIDNNKYHYMITDTTGNNEYYHEYTVPDSIIRYINYHKPTKQYRRDNKEFIIYQLN